MEEDRFKKMLMHLDVQQKDYCRLLTVIFFGHLDLFARSFFLWGYVKNKLRESGKSTKGRVKGYYQHRRQIK